MTGKGDKKKKGSQTPTEEEILKILQSKDSKYSKLFFVFIVALFAISVTVWGILYSTLLFKINSQAGEIEKTLKRISERYIAVSPDLRLIVKANIIKPDIAREIVEAFVEHECNFAESKVWSITAPYPSFEIFLKKSPLVVKWEKYFLTPQALGKFRNFALFLYTQGKNNSLPEYFFPQRIKTVNFLFKKDNSFEWRGSVEYTTFYLSMTTGKWVVGKAEMQVYLRGKINFLYADPVNNPYGMRVEDFTFSVPLKPQNI